MKTLILFIIPVFANALTHGLDYFIEYAATPKNNYKYALNIKEDHEHYQITIDQNIIDWIRYKEVLITPRIKIDFNTKKNVQTHLKYNGSTMLLQRFKKQFFASFYVYPFLNDQFDIYENGKKVRSIKIKVENNGTPPIVDYSCSFMHTDIKNNDIPTIIGCLRKDEGSFLQQKKNVSLLVSTANYKIKDHKENDYSGAYLVPVKRRANISLKLQDEDEKQKEITGSLKFSPRAPKLGLAFGFGPYMLNSKFQDIELDPGIAPAVMLYGNFQISEDFSIRGFDALVSKQSMFNNAGLYLANDIVKAFDRKLRITTLLGVQYLNFKFDKGFQTFNEPIYPQGIEFTYKHAFDIKNYVISGGVFLSPSNDVDYSNMWIRWGKGYYWELNYIGWAQDDYEVSMWGVSLIFPLGRFF